MLCLALAGALCVGTSANATTLTLDDGWQPFSFSDGGSAWSEDFTFTLLDTAYFAVTDAFCAGDQFEFTVNGTVEGVTSVPFYDGTCTGPTSTTDADAAFASSVWSSGEIELGAGDYTISGIAVLSPFGQGAAFVQLSSTSLGGPVIAPPTSPVPLPAGGLLLVAGLGGMAALRRRKKTDA